MDHADRVQLDNISVHMSRTNGAEGRPFQLRIKDETSGVRIAEIMLGEEAIANLISAAIGYGSGEVTTPERYRFVGMNREVTSERVPDDRLVQTYDQAERRAALEPYAETRRQAVGADTVRIDHNRNGWFLSFETFTQASNAVDA